MTLGASEFIVSLDADMLPEHDWLRMIIPHLIIDNIYSVFALLPPIMRLQMHLTATRYIDSYYPFLIYPGVIVRLLNSIGNISILASYMAFQPTLPERNDLIAEDGKGVRRPKEGTH